MSNRKKEADALKRIFNRVKHDKKLDYGVVAKLMKLGEGNRSQVSHMLNGLNPINLIRALQFCEILGITLDEWSPRLAREADEIAILQSKGSSEKTVYWPGKHSENTYMVSVEGEACEPELQRGSIAVIDTDREPVPGKLFAFIDGTLRFAKFNGDGYAEFLNPDYPDRIFKITKKIKTLGLVIGSQNLL